MDSLKNENILSIKNQTSILWNVTLNYFLNSVFQHVPSIPTTTIYLFPKEVLRSLPPHQLSYPLKAESQGLNFYHMLKLILKE